MVLGPAAAASAFARLRGIRPRSEASRPPEFEQLRGGAVALPAAVREDLHMPTFLAAIRVQPGARTNQVGGAVPPLDARGDQPCLQVRVRARIVDGAATAAAARAVAEALAVRPRQVSVVKGHTAREELVKVIDPPADIAERWQRLLDAEP